MIFQDPKVIDYIPSKTGLVFHGSMEDIRLVMGPVASGKSTMCIIELIIMARHQKVDKNNERTSKWLIVRQTYPQLLDTTYASFKLWLKPNKTTRRYTAGMPMRIRWTDRLDDGTKMNAEFIFKAVSKPEDYEDLKSFELTGAFINEVGGMDGAIVPAVRSRLGRFPASLDAVDIDHPITRSSLIMDTNPPEDDGWVSKIEETKPRGWDFFHQPPALLRDIKEDLGYVLNPAGENFRYIGIGPVEYYLDRIGGMTPEQIKVLFLGQYGVTSSGKAVYHRQWEHDYHVAKTRLSPVKGIDIIIGWDWGRGGEACVIGQIMKTGQLRILHEVYGDNMTLRAFAEDIVQPWLLKRFGPDTLGEGEKPWKIISIGDPAGLGSSGLSLDSRNYFHILNDKEVGVFRDWFITRPANYQHAEMRLNAVRHFLTEKTSQGSPLFQIDSRCKMLLKGFNQSYEYQRKQIMGTAQFKDSPSKDPTSHVHDALQYLCLVAHPNYKLLKQHTEFVTQTRVHRFKTPDITNYS